MKGDRPALLTGTLVGVPEADDWLSTAECEVLAGLRVPARRRDWRLGRWVAKRAVGWLLDVDPARLEIVAASDGAPEPLIDGHAAPAAISISHRGGLAACLATPAGIAPGCDLELIELRAQIFVRDFFTAGELAFVEGRPVSERDLFVNLIWSVKESALKALRQGLRLDTREVEVALDLDDEVDLGWRTVRVSYGARTLKGWWRVEGRHVLTAVTEPPAKSPLVLP